MTNAASVSSEAMVERPGYSDNPYSMSPENLQHLLVDMIATTPAYIDNQSNPDIGEFSVYFVDGKDRFSDVARALEGTIFNTEWGFPPEATANDFSAIENNSEYFMLIDKSQAEGPKIAGALRIADCMRGPSETVGFFHEYFGGDKPLPTELNPDEATNTLWDVVSVVVDPEYRNGEQAAWLYHALYTKSIESGVSKWISNITPKEMRSLRSFIGIPFVEVPGLEQAEYESPIDGRKTPFGFYSIDVDTIFPEVSANISEKEAKESSLNQLLVRLARISLLGVVSESQ